MSETRVNPIEWVANAATPSTHITISPAPSAFQWKLEDVSSSDAGRTEAVTMDKMRIGQIRALELSWSNITTAQASAILKAFNPEYLHVRYLDPMVGDFRTSEFYVGNRSAPLYNATLGVWSNVSFNIIERSGRDI